MYSLFSFIVGILLVVFFVFVLSGIELFSVGPTTYPAFFIFILTYTFAGWALYSASSDKKTAPLFLVAFPMWLFLYLLNFSDYAPREVLPRWLTSLSPFSSHFGILLDKLAGRMIRS
ncbi:MAG: hypothetical protein HY451_01010 [Parcubacteria group bacterium]|nr:hypothetical protein [Parcubacteria group bacterium]